jgi:hypothetical protein
MFRSTMTIASILFALGLAGCVYHPYGYGDHYYGRGYYRGQYHDRSYGGDRYYDRDYQYRR